MEKPKNWWRDGVFHVELPNCIVNLRPRISEGMDHVEIIPNDYPGFKVELEPDVRNIRVRSKKVET